jgi:hypothetical protein
MNQTFNLPSVVDRTRYLAHIMRVLSSLPMECGFTLEVKKMASRRSLSQNRMLWALYEQIIERGGETMAGWEKEELHEFFLIECFGSEVLQMFGRKKLRPRRRSSKLSKQEFGQFVDFIVRFMARQGVCLDMPGDALAVAA